MKKNLMSVLIFALVFVNLIFSAVITFAVVPAIKNANDLIFDIAAAIDLNLNDGKDRVPLQDITYYKVSAGEKMPISLKPGEDGKNYQCIVSVYIGMNSKHEDYKTYGENIADRDSMIKDRIRDIISSYTREEVENTSTQVEIKEEILEKLRSEFNSYFIIEVGFDFILCQ